MPPRRTRRQPNVGTRKGSVVANEWSYGRCWRRFYYLIAYIGHQSREDRSVCWRASRLAHLIVRSRRAQRARMTPVTRARRRASSRPINHTPPQRSLTHSLTQPTSARALHAPSKRSGLILIRRRCDVENIKSWSTGWAARVVERASYDEVRSVCTTALSDCKIRQLTVT